MHVLLRLEDLKAQFHGIYVSVACFVAKAQFHGIYVSNDLNVLLNCKII